MRAIALKHKRLAVVAAGAAAAMAIGLAAPGQASASTGIFVPNPTDLINCLVGTVDQLLYGGPPPVDACAGVPGGV
jgi:hypothetical protein